MIRCYARERRRYDDLLYRGRLNLASWFFELGICRCTQLFLFENMLKSTTKFIPDSDTGYYLNVDLIFIKVPVPLLYYKDPW